MFYFTDIDKYFILIIIIITITNKEKAMSTIRYSKQRETIYKILKNDYSHPSVDEIYHQVRKVIPDISLGTVYRNLIFLAEQNRIISFKVNDKAHYDARITPHFHFICQECGEISDIEINKNIIDNIVNDIEKKSGHKLNDIQIIINGTCAKCIEREEKGK